MRVPRIHGIRRMIKIGRRVIRQRRRLRGAGGPVVWWMLTPSARMRNLGDQAQAVANQRWLREQVGIDPIELDKDEFTSLAPLLRFVVRPGELILLESGGNLGERGILTERMRRRVIGDFRRNPVIVLPQTISFSDTKRGRTEADASSVVYRSHPALEVVARDAASLDRGRALFPEACHVMAPDPVLTMADAPRGTVRSGVLLVLRGDRERRIRDDQVPPIEAALDGMAVTRSDTIADHPVRRGRRARVIHELLAEMARHELVVTDRFHGMVFAFVTDTPCIVLENIDHKVRSGHEWLAECPSIRLASPDEPLRPLIETVLAAPRPSECAATQARLRAAQMELEGAIRDRLSLDADR